MRGKRGHATVVGGRLRRVRCTEVNSLPLGLRLVDSLSSRFGDITVE
jgi:hypothetical protein